MSEYKCDDSICNDLIEFFRQNKHNASDGKTNNTVIKEVKDSIDLGVHPKDDKEPVQNYTKFLWDCMEDYVKIYPYLRDVYTFSITEVMNIQKYPIGGGFKLWHTERNGAFDLTIKRVLVFMTYLNDVEDGGTEFLHQNKTIKAEKGKTLIWPSDWTHAHRGQVSYTKEKMIITGWFSHLWD